MLLRETINTMESIADTSDFGIEFTQIALPPLKRDLGAFRVLVVEDDPLNQRAAVLMLEEMGVHAITVAGNGAEALQSLVSTPCDLVLMDVMMPLMDGLEAVKEIRNQERHSRFRKESSPSFSYQLPIIGLAAFSTIADREACLSAGMDDCLFKPVRLAEFHAAVAKWMPSEPDQRGLVAELAASSKTLGIHGMGEASPSGEMPLSILLVEDDLPHAEIVRRNLNGSSIPHRLIHVGDGQAALDYLYRQNEYADLVSDALPDLILLDVNMPKVGGFEVMRQIRDNEKLGRIPCVVLTTSSASLDREAARSLGAAGYQIKPISSERFADLLNNWPNNLAQSLQAY